MLKLLVSLVGLLFRSHTGLLAENVALRHHLSVLQRTARRPRLKARDRVLFENSVERSCRFSVVMAEDRAESFASRDRA